MAQKTQLLLILVTFVQLNARAKNPGNAKKHQQEKGRAG